MAPMDDGLERKDWNNGPEVLPGIHELEIDRLLAITDNVDESASYLGDLGDAFFQATDQPFLVKVFRASKPTISERLFLRLRPELLKNLETETSKLADLEPSHTLEDDSSSSPSSNGTQVPDSHTSEADDEQYLNDVQDTPCSLYGQEHFAPECDASQVCPEEIDLPKYLTSPKEELSRHEYTTELNLASKQVDPLTQSAAPHSNKADLSNETKGLSADNPSPPVPGDVSLNLIGKFSHSHPGQTFIPRALDDLEAFEALDKGTRSRGATSQSGRRAQHSSQRPKPGASQSSGDPKRKRENSSDGNNKGNGRQDEEGHGKGSSPPESHDQGKHKSYGLMCPFFKHIFFIYCTMPKGVGLIGSCLSPHIDFDAIKEHLGRVHADKLKHITRELLRDSTSETRKFKTDAEKWSRQYQILFYGGEDKATPSPYFEPDLPISEIFDNFFEWYARSGYQERYRNQLSANDPAYLENCQAALDFVRTDIMSLFSDHRAGSKLADGPGTSLDSSSSGKLTSQSYTESSRSSYTATDPGIIEDDFIDPRKVMQHFPGEAASLNPNVQNGTRSCENDHEAMNPTSLSTPELELLRRYTTIDEHDDSD